MDGSFPNSVIIVGAGVFGLSTALVINRRFPSTKVTMIDRFTPPVADGTSVDTSRIIRPDYVDPEYQSLADLSRQIIKDDPGLRPHYFERGFTFCTDGKPGRMEELWAQMFENVKATQPASGWNQLDSPDAVFRHLHGANAEPSSTESLGREKTWVKGYTSKRCATVDAEAMVKVYYDRARSKSNIAFVLGTPVDRLVYGGHEGTAVVEGVCLEDGRVLRADNTVVATGAWSSRLVNLEGVVRSNAVPIAYIKLTDKEYKMYKDIACHTHLNSGLNIFTPLRGFLKVLKRSTGLYNTVDMKDPEDESKTYRASIPLTKVDDPLQTIPTEIEAAIRDDLREIFPSVAENRPFHSSKMCWENLTTNGEFLICPHPRLSNLHMATGGSLHAWKFLPLLGEFVVDSMSGTLRKELVQKWSWESKMNATLGPLGFMTEGHAREIREVAGARVEL